MISRRSTLTLTAVLAMLPAVSPAQDWPSRPVTVIVPFAAGSSVDVLTRAMGIELAKSLNTTVVVENVNGAGGVLATSRAVSAKPDGHTFVMGAESTILLAEMVRPTTVRYNGMRDLTLVGQVVAATLVVLAKPELPVSDVASLVAYTRSQPQGVSYATTGIGTSLHIAGEIMAQEGQMNLVHVPYSVSTQIMTDLAGNQLDMAIMPVGAALPFIRSGKVKAIAVTSRERFPLLPNVQALAETRAFDKVNLDVWWGVFAPKGVPAPIVERMTREVTAIFEKAEMRKQVSDLGFKPAVQDPVAFNKSLLAEQARYRAIVSERNIKAD